MNARSTSFDALIAAALLLAAVSSPAAPVPLSNGGFEQAAASRAASWSVVGTLPPAAIVVRDAEVKRAGAASLRLSATSPASITVASDEVRLEVGHVYRLSAFVRTENAVSDPTGRYPTPVAATLAMESFPFTNHSPSAGATRPFGKVETLFVATTARDRVRLQLGRNGAATGTAWFDDVTLEEVTDVRELVPMETVRWHGPAFRYDEKGWIYVHVEGEPYERGFQYGSLVAEELAEYVKKLGIQENPKDGPGAWAEMRFFADAVFLRKYDEEYLLEMKGIADGAAKAGAKVDGRPVDFLDVVTMNSSIDLDYAKSALRSTPHPLTGRSFLTSEDEAKIPERAHKCSSFVATGEATKDGRPVFGQIFMWAGYTGVHFNVIADVVPSKGHRLVYQTYPGGIHSGTDYYMNAAGILIGETTVAQTPWNVDGTPMSNRIRKAAQYASSIDDVARILREKNNGMYTNDWPIVDVKTGEVAILLLGTKESKLWRTGEDPAPFGTPGFLWANNNARDPGVKREYGVQPDDAPFDPVYGPWDRDVAFRKWYDEVKGRIDATEAVNLWASSPINRPHACDGKVTTAEMAEKLVFLAHYGKVTLREKFPAAGNRRMPDHPGAIPHLTLGYAVFSPVYIAEKLKEAKAKEPKAAAAPKEPALDVTAVEERLAYDATKLWKGSVFPKTEGTNGLVSGAAAYWRLLKGLPKEPARAFASVRDELAGLNARAAWFAAKEGDVAIREATREYGRRSPYQIPRIKGTFALHQLRLLLGNERFRAATDAAFTANAGREVTAEELVATLSKGAGRDVASFLAPWIEEKGFPDPKVEARARKDGKGWRVTLTVTQEGRPYHFLGSVAIDAGGRRLVKPFEAKGARTEVAFTVDEKPTRLEFDAGRDLPVPLENPYTFLSFTDEFRHAKVVYGTTRQVEANHTLALRFQTLLADTYSEELPPVVKDSELTETELAASDLFVLGAPSDNALAARLAGKLPATFGPGWFAYGGKTYGRSDDGLYLCLPNPWNPERVVWLFAGNSALQLHQMTKAWGGSLPQWAVYRSDEVRARGFTMPARHVFERLAE
ncbi:MAG TPA: C45 family autoproteolytic acyltransferase/hydrolase [Thermoanaerobaculia bacterium]|nr:C45 family autoproteolytic acyltransferase/hydrolase [Thermoanaerobaculia bacterium]HQP84896.1 C45 family autoproteolytic acyltransferase/hydrolase [Thermoanaerobaculia bacterium]